MIHYNVTVTINAKVHDEWIQWMTEHHIPEVLATGLFVDNFIVRHLPEDSFTYTFHYRLRDEEAYDTYQRDFAPALQIDHANRYAGKFSAKRTLGIQL